MNDSTHGTPSDCIELPLIAMRELVVFPHNVIPHILSTHESRQAMSVALEDKRLVLFAFVDPEADQEDHPYAPVGTVGKIVQIFKLKDGSTRMLTEALYRCSICSYHTSSEDVTYGRVRPIIEKRNFEDERIQALTSGLKSLFAEYAAAKGQITNEILVQVRDAKTPDACVDSICGHMNFDYQLKLEILCSQSVQERLEHTSVLLETERQMLSVRSDIQKKVKQRLEQAQKEYFLSEQIRQINKELGRESDEVDEAQELFEAIKRRDPPREVLEKAQKEANRLRKLQAMSPESGVIRTYLEWLGDLPWSERSDDTFDIAKARKILDEDHYNMRKAKERILDYIAVRSIKKSLKGPILCLVGPPGTGKTSLGKSVARTLGRNFIRVSLGGVRDEAEIRGHRKTYVGALPGKIIQSMKKSGTKNPVFLLDEIDKMASDFRGDPSSAMLEVLDPEQNSTFSDHYLEVPFDLSQVLFIATANSLHTIPAPLRDRMEIIEIPGYSDYEKVRIAMRFLIPKQLSEHGLDEKNIRFQSSALTYLIDRYTMESGVRTLERSIAAVIRKTTRMFARRTAQGAVDTSFSKVITKATIEKLLGKPRYGNDLVNRESAVGRIHGLAWTELGGRMLSVEAALLPGNGKLILTGSLGEIMKESARISLSYIIAHAQELELDPEVFSTHDMHIHVPQGAIPKDGPSAGVTIACALLSAAKGICASPGLSMTGEVTLTGLILPIGGVKEKLLASYRNGIYEVLLPKDNEKDVLEDLPKKVLSSMRITYCLSLLQLFSIVFGPDSKSSECSEKDQEEA